MINFQTVFKNACEHIEKNYIDRVFIENTWPGIKSKFLDKIRGITDEPAAEKKGFEDIMENLVSALNLSHTMFITPEFSETAAAQENPETAPDFLFPKFRHTDEYHYIKISSMTIPIFSWKIIGPEIKRIIKDNTQGGPRPVIIDLRLNNGGAISASGSLLALFTGPGRHFCTSRLSKWKETGPARTQYPFDEDENESNRLDVLASAEYAYLNWHTSLETGPILENRLIVLTGPRTYSSGEIFAQAAKELTSAVLLGKRSAGAVVGARDDFECGHGYRLLLPFVDLVSADGVRLEGCGVAPHKNMDFKTPDTEMLSQEECIYIIESI